MTPADLYRFRWLSDPQASPDGGRVAFVVTHLDRQERDKAYRSEIWAVPTAGGEPARLTAGPRDRHPRWSPDGRSLAFVSNRGGEDQIYVLPADGGDARPVTARKGGVASPPVWSPDGRWLAFLAKVGPERGPDDSDVRVYTRIRYKLDGQGLFDHRYRQVFIVAADAGADPNPVQLTDGDWDKSDPVWSRDGAAVIFTGNPDPEDADLHGGVDLFAVAAHGGGPAAPRRLTATPGPKSALSVSPDGRTIAYLGHDDHLHGATDVGVWTVAYDPQAASPAVPRLLTGGLTATAGDHILCDMRIEAPASPPAWSADGRTLRFLATDGGTCQLFAVPADGSAPPRALTSGRHEVYAFSGEALAIADPSRPGELYVGGRRLTDLNPWLADVDLAEPQPFTFQGSGDWRCEGWVLPPLAWRPDAAPRSFPAILEIHGGPHACYGETFMHEFQVLAAAGYAVIYCNPCGSTGYGESFTARTRHDWGGHDYADVMACVDAALDRFPFIDPERLGVTGGSYGGFLTNWIVTRTDRFRAAVTQRSTCNRLSFFGTSDGGYRQAEFEFAGFPWDDPQAYLRHSPLMYVRNVRTPILILHSENDLRCPIEQAEQWFVALRRLGKVAEFVRFPDESHGLSRSGKPRHRIERLERIVGWFDRYIPR